MGIKLLGVALGLASLAGINLYLTVFVTGLAIHYQWIALGPQYHDLAVLGHPVIIVVAAVLYFAQFFADKIPWVDSLWDSIHTVIRPVGGILLAMSAFGHVNPFFETIIGLLAGTAALTMHGLKAGTRIIANTSPEPFSNIALSVAEDVTVVGGLALIYFHPGIALAVLGIIFACAFYFGPKILRVLRTRLWLVWRKLNAPASDTPDGALSAALPPDHDLIFTRVNLTGEKIEWVARCISTASRRIPANYSGYLVATVEEPRKLWFVAKSGWGRIAELIDLEGCTISRESKFLTENLLIHHPDGKHKSVFLFDRTRKALVGSLVASLERRLGAQAPVAVQAETPPEPAAPSGKESEH